MAALVGFRVVGGDDRAAPVDVPVWPTSGQAAVAVTAGGRTALATHADGRPAPVASMAKVMTAYVVLQEAPLAAGADGFTMTITPEQVHETSVRRRRGESVVRVVAGEQLTERQALQALLLPSANNVATALAEHVAGSRERFVQQMNEQAVALGMTSTRYTDPSGYETSTVSTARDQLLLAMAAMQVPALAEVVGQRSAVLPVAGRVENTDRLLGHDGFVGIKTGSMRAAGGCFMFQAVRRVDGHRTVITGVVMGQPGRDLVDAGQDAAARLVDGVEARLRTGGTSAVR
ncbi:hypothetical protein GCM10028814_34720 [Angustibacter aerolatus]